MAVDPTGGYWTVSGLGVVTSHGGVPVFGSPAQSGVRLVQPIVAMAATPDGNGYWLVASDGGVFAFGDARFYGSTGTTHLSQPIVAMAATPDGNGYWLVASDGGVFAFGDARFYGSTGTTHLSQPIVAMAATPDGNGYWLVASDGGVFAFGDARFSGSTGTTHLSQPIVAMAATPDGNGYWLVASDGGVFAFGDARFYGSLGASDKTVLGILVNSMSAGYTLIQSDGSAISLSAPSASGNGAPTSSTAIPITNTTTNIKNTPRISTKITTKISTAPKTPSSPTSVASKVPATHTGTSTLTAGTPGMDFGGDETNIWNMTYGQQLATFAQVRAAGAQWIRWTVPMAGEETGPGQFNWYTAQELQAAVASGLKVDVLLTDSPAWAATADGSPSAADFAAFAKAAAKEFAPLGISTFEIWNEENDTQSWGAAFTPTEYTAVLRASYAAIKAQTPMQKYSWAVWRLRPMHRMEPPTSQSPFSPRCTRPERKGPSMRWPTIPTASPIYPSRPTHGIHSPTCRRFTRSW